MSLKFSPSLSSPSRGFWVTLLLLVVVLASLFGSGWLPGHVLFSNDGPLGAITSQYWHLPDAFTGTWADLNSLGSRTAAVPGITYGLQWVLGPVGYAKFYVPLGLLILGLGAWCFFRQLGLAPLACALGGLAATLNSGFFSAACWGLAAHPITIGMAFFALAALVDTTSRRRWLRVAVAGMAVGMGVVEGADIGAIFSLYVAAWVVYQAWTSEGQRGPNLALGVGRVAVVAGFAAFMAAQSISVLVATNIQGVAGTQQDNRSREERWDWATQWSLPKREALGIVVPGLFGYRMDTPEGGNYWGAAGRDPAWYRYWAGGSQGQPPGGFMRFTGGGNYAGILVVLVAAWAAAQALRKKDSVFSLQNRRWLWFWMGVGVISLLLAFGRFAPFYRLLYALPYFSTIRNPAKFTHLVNWSLVVLFAYGVHGLWIRYLEAPAAAGGSGVIQTLKAWWQKVRGFDRRWTVGCVVALAVSALAFLIYGSSKANLEQYLQQVQFDQAMAKAIATFSVTQAGIFVLLLAVAVGLLTLVLSGAFAGPRAKWGAALLGLFVLADLGRANLPWILPVNYEQKLATNPIIERLRVKPYEQRVAIVPEWLSRAVRAPADLDLLNQLYRIEWAQHHFLYYNVPSLDIVQMSRMPEDLLAFETALQPHSNADMPRLLTRRWELTNTRYLLGPAGFLDLLNQQIDSEHHRFRILDQFQIVPKPGIARPSKLEELTAVPATNGPFALFEFSGALPRARLYSAWQVNTNNAAVLQELTAASFDPQKSVIVSSPIPPSPAAGATNGNPGKVEFTSYAPKRIVFKTEAPTPTVLLLNDRYDADWKVSVDGQPQPLLRCNYLMRGVQVPAGVHRVEFRFAPPVNVLYVTLAAIGVALILCLLLLVVKDSPAEPAIRNASAPASSARAESAKK